MIGQRNGTRVKRKKTPHKEMVEAVFLETLLKPGELEMGLRFGDGVPPKRSWGMELRGRGTLEEKLGVGGANSSVEFYDTGQV